MSRNDLTFINDLCRHALKRGIGAQEEALIALRMWTDSQLYGYVPTLVIPADFHGATPGEPLSPVVSPSLKRDGTLAEHAGSQKS